MSAKITINRDSGWADRIRDYNVCLNDIEIGRISNGETKTFEIEPGDHELRLKIDWCGSNTVQFSTAENQSLSFDCGSNLRGLNLFISIFFIFFAPRKYLWLKNSTTS